MLFINKKWNANLVQPGVLLLFICGFFQLNAQSRPNATWKKANQFYAQNQYDSAIHLYKQLARDSMSTAIVYYNLGNAFYRASNYEKAVICYKIALLKDYGNQKIMDNLNLAKSKVEKPVAEAQPIFFEVWGQKLLHFFSPVFWGVFSFACFAGILVLLFYKQTRKKIIPYFERWMATAVALFLLVFILFYQSTNALSNDKAKALEMERRI